MTYLTRDSYDLAALARLRAAPGLSEAPTLADAELVLVRSRTRVDAEFLARAPKLKFVVTATSGFDHLDWRACRARGVVVAHTPEANADATAELTMTLLLAFARNLNASLRNVRAGRWREDLVRPRGLAGETLGVVGLGRVGGRVATLARAFGMMVRAHDPYVDDARFAQTGTERSGFTELLRTSEFVSLHVPLTTETKHLMDQQTFGEMPRGSVLVNTCRGAVVNENDLLAALDDDRLAGAAVDVLEREPPPKGHRLLDHPRLLMTPHVGAFTDTAWARSSDEAVTKALAFARGEDVSDTLPSAAPWFLATVRD